MQEDRIDALEATVKRLNRRVRWLTIALVVAGSACLTGQTQGIPDVVRCHALQVIDGNGALAASIVPATNNGTEFNDFYLYPPTATNRQALPLVSLRCANWKAWVDCSFGDVSRCSMTSHKDESCITTAYVPSNSYAFIESNTTQSRVTSDNVN